MKNLRELKLHSFVFCFTKHDLLRKHRNMSYFKIVVAAEACFIESVFAESLIATEGPL